MMWLKPGVHRSLVYLAAGIVVSLSPFSAARAATCPADPAMPALSLPHLRAALMAGAQGVIVALGSSSTQGAAASTPAESYPAVLQTDLSAGLPDIHVAVLNRGMGGQDAPRELDRIEADVIAVRPQLVVWQVGTNAALRHMDAEAFHADVVVGVRRAQAAGIDVVLMDNQRSPRVLAAGTEDVAIDQALARAAEETGASLFSRDHLMLAWEAQGAAPAEFTSPDKLHHNDRGYRCLARSLARAIVRAVRPQSLVAGP
ncbi:MAG: SGNH/GDSL hydrolase family protein [Acetobacteraceae bacterium]